MNALESTGWIQAWSQMAAPNEPQKFQRRLDWDGWSAESFQSWLCTDPAELETGSSWMGRGIG